MIHPGERLPNIVGSDQAGQPFMLYHFSCGSVGAIWLAENTPSTDDVMQALDNVPAHARVLLVTPGPLQAPEDDRIGVIADDGTLRSQLMDGDSGDLWIAFDEHLRVTRRGPSVPDAWTTRWNADDSQASIVQSVAPVLTLPRILDAEICDALIEAHASAPDLDPASEPFNPFGPVARGRRETVLDDQALTRQINQVVGKRLLPEIAFAFAYGVQAFERIRITSHDSAEEGGYSAHRINLIPDNRHRAFALIASLNDDYEGGEIVFPEFGPQRFRVPAGGVLVYSGSLAQQMLPVTSGVRYDMVSYLFQEPVQQAAQQPGQQPAPQGGQQPPPNMPPANWS
ncbi:MAG: hypothetical protein QNJ40_13025 [Xanthomonadales bacterium]|nr:hypothetical protein [Xanthomonadales bacterium]